MMPPTTNFIDRSWSVRGAPAFAPLAAAPRKSASPLRSPAQMIGSERTRLMMPPAATAPAPMYRMYADWICDTRHVRRSGWPAPGRAGRARPRPKYLIAGINTRYDSTPPATMIDEMRGPMM